MMATNYGDNNDIIEILIKLWNFVKDAITECENKQLDILFDLVVTLLDSTHLGNLQNDAFCAVYSFFFYLFTKTFARISFSLYKILMDLCFNISDFDIHRELIYPFAIPCQDQDLSSFTMLRCESRALQNSERHVHSDQVVRLLARR